MGKKQVYPYFRQVRLNASSINAKKLDSFDDDLMLLKNNKIRKFLVPSCNFLYFCPSFLILFNLQLDYDRMPWVHTVL